MNSDRELFRHTLATLAYRAARALEDSPESFAGFDGTGRTPAQILAHMGDLFNWALSMAEGNQGWHNSEPLPWAEEQSRFFAALKALDTYLVSGERIHAPLDRLFRARWPTRSPMLASSPCCAGWPAAPFAAKTTMWPRSQPGMWAQIYPRQ
jgi:hypothetical protein